MIRRPPRSTLFPYTRSSDLGSAPSHRMRSIGEAAPPESSGLRDCSSPQTPTRSEEHTSELQSRRDLVCRLLLEKKKQNPARRHARYHRAPCTWWLCTCGCC